MRPGPAGGMRDVVVVGGSIAALTAVETLRMEDFPGRITVLSAEDVPPYTRVPLSKGVLAGTESVDDVVSVVRWAMDGSGKNGIFNVGTGKAESFRDMIVAMFKAMGRAPNIEYIDMPMSIRDQYQYFTQADVGNLRRAGYNAGFTPLDKAVAQYVTGYLDQVDRYK